MLHRAAVMLAVTASLVMAPSVMGLDVAAAQPPEKPGKTKPDETKPGKAKRDKAKRDKAKKRIDQLRNKLLRKRLGLDEATATKVEKVLRDHVTQKRQVQRDMRQAQRKLRQLLRDDSDDQDAYRKALAALEKAHASGEALRKKHFAELQKLLTPKQQVQLIQAMHKIKRHLNRQRRRGMDRRGPRGPRRPRGPRPQDPGF